MSKDRRATNFNQARARRHTFPHNQYWFLSYTEHYSSGLERDFKTIIKARSAELAKQILISRLKEDEGFKKISSATISMIHEWWQVSTLRRKLSITQWKAIRTISFPNEWNKIFKFEKERIEGQLNRYNVPPTKVSPSHKSRLAKSAKKLVDEYIRGSFKPMCPKLRKICSTDKYCKAPGQRRHFANLRNPDHAKMEKDYLKKVMAQYYGNINWAADATNTHRSVFRRALKRFPEVNWKKEFPLTKTRPGPENSMDSPAARAKLSNTLRAMGHRPPPNKKGTPQYKKWLKTIRPTLKAKKETLYTSWKERLIDALRDNNHKRAETAEALGISVGYMNRLMSRFAQEDSDFKKEFWSPEISQRLKEASCRKTYEAKRRKFATEHKHVILQAYYQNDQKDYRAAKKFGVDPRTFRTWREDIEKYEV